MKNNIKKIREKLVNLAVGLSAGLLSFAFSGCIDLPEFPHYRQEKIDLSGNKQYKIGVVQVVSPPEYDFSNKYLCLTSNKIYPDGGYVPSGVRENCEELTSLSNSIAAVRQIPLSDLIFSDSEFINVDNLGYNNQTSIDAYSPRHADSFLEGLLDRTGITRGTKDLFKMDFLSIVGKEDTIAQNSKASVMDWFKNAVAENEIDLSPYDFVMYLQYQTEFNRPFSRAFRHGNSSYINFDLFYNDGIIDNKKFFTMVHEGLHQIFDVGDLYVSDGSTYIQYPRGVPDPDSFPNTKGCVMAGFGIASERTSELTARKYNDSFQDQNPPYEELGRFHTMKMENYTLCPATIETILHNSY